MDVNPDRQRATGRPRRSCHFPQAHPALIDAAIDNRVEQIRRDGAIAAHRLALARLLELHVAAAAQFAAGLRLLQPAVEVSGGHGEKLEAHIGKAGAAVIGREALILARPVDHRVEAGRHARHRIDLSCQRRDEERIHHRRCRNLEVDGGVYRRRELVHDGDILIRIDEQPFPVESDDFDGQGFYVVRNRSLRIDPRQRPIRVQRMGADPGKCAQGDDDKQRRRPNE
jgi:hypothetical protein